MPAQILAFARLVRGLVALRSIIEITALAGMAVLWFAHATKGRQPSEETIRAKVVVTENLQLAASGAAVNLRWIPIGKGGVGFRFSDKRRSSTLTLDALDDGNAGILFTREIANLKSTMNLFVASEDKNPMLDLQGPDKKAGLALSLFGRDQPTIQFMDSGRSRLSFLVRDRDRRSTALLLNGTAKNPVLTFGGSDGFATFSFWDGVANSISSLAFAPLGGVRFSWSDRKGGQLLEMVVDGDAEPNVKLTDPVSGFSKTLQ